MRKLGRRGRGCHPSAAEVVDLLRLMPIYCWAYGRLGVLAEWTCQVSADLARTVVGTGSTLPCEKHFQRLGISLCRYICGKNVFGNGIGARVGGGGGGGVLAPSEDILLYSSSTALLGLFGVRLVPGREICPTYIRVRRQKMKKDSDETRRAPKPAFVLIL